jgi:hypothetical protein
VSFIGTITTITQSLCTGKKKPVDRDMNLFLTHFKLE